MKNIIKFIYLLGLPVLGVYCLYMYWTSELIVYKIHYGIFMLALMILMLDNTNRGHKNKALQLNFFHYFLDVVNYNSYICICKSDINMELIGKKIREKRKERNLTQEELGKKIGACYVTICNLEKGRNVSSHVLRNACKELNLELTVIDKVE